MIVRRTALLPLPAEHLYDIIEAAENYPRFLPWCAGAQLVFRDDNVVSADLRVKWGGMSFEMRTRNPKRRPEYMAIHLERGPFKRFEGEWVLTVLSPEACKVAFNLDYEFDSGLMTRVAGPVFKRLTDTMVEAFIQHALATPVGAAPRPLPTVANMPVPVPAPAAPAFEPQPAANEVPPPAADARPSPDAHEAPATPATPATPAMPEPPDTPGTGDTPETHHTGPATPPP